MRLAILSVALLAGCNATMPQSPTAADDPSFPCYRAMDDNPLLQPLVTKVGSLSSVRGIGFGTLSNQERPTEMDKPLLREWADARQHCTELGRSFRAKNAPPAWRIAFDNGQMLGMQLLAALYAGQMTYGEFAARRQQLASETSAQLNNADRQNNADMQARAAQQQAASAAAMQNYLLMMQAQQPYQPIQPYQPPPQVNCRTVYSGNVATTRCN